MSLSFKMQEHTSRGGSWDYSMPDSLLGTVYRADVPSEHLSYQAITNIALTKHHLENSRACVKH